MGKASPVWLRRAGQRAHKARLHDLEEAIEYLRTAQKTTPLIDECRAIADPLQECLDKIILAGPKTSTVQDALVTLGQAAGVACAVINSGPLGSRAMLFQAAYLIGYSAATLNFGAAMARKGADALHKDSRDIKGEFMDWWAVKKGSMTKSAAADAAVKLWPAKRSSYIRWLSGA